MGVILKIINNLKKKIDLNHKLNVLIKIKSHSTDKSRLNMIVKPKLTTLDV
jgi:hypothetical protein|tara:strand:- start:1613 stop:1765 length:153 start_codon:yes stop_codon:yes gene_type:complete